MPKEPKNYEPMDVALSTVIEQLLSEPGVTLRPVAERAGMSHNRLGKIKRRDTPPASPGEIDRIARALDTSASAVFAAAEAFMAGRDDYMTIARESNVIPLRAPVSDPADNVALLAAGDSVQGEMESYEN